MYVQYFNVCVRRYYTGPPYVQYMYIVHVTSTGALGTIPLCYTICILKGGRGRGAGGRDSLGHICQYAGQFSKSLCSRL
jgi:hypothetical protein